eukprot:55515_1
MASTQSSVHITGYWEGYSEQSQDPFPLNQVPRTVSTIPIAFIMPIKEHESDPLATQWAFDTQIIYTPDQVKQWVQEINNRDTNQQVLLSILDTPEIHWYPDVDIDQFAQNIATSVEEWGLGGIDVDAESGMSDPSQQYVKTFVHLIKSLRKYLSSSKIITYTCYTQSEWDTQIISQCKDDIEHINTMAYWNGTEAQIGLYQHYANDIGDANKVGIGVSAGDGVSSTTLDTVKGVANWLRDNNDIKQKRMMLWSLTRDIKEITTTDNCIYFDTIYANITPNINQKGGAEGSYKAICAKNPVFHPHTDAIARTPSPTIKAIDRYSGTIARRKKSMTLRK